MHKINTNRIEEYSWFSLKGKYAGFGKGVSEELGRKPLSMDLLERHPLDVEILRVPAGKTPYPYHSHSAQWEFYHFRSGRGMVRHEEGSTAIEAVDDFLFPPEKPHQLINDSTDDLILSVIADIPIGESVFYPDSGKWGVRSPKRVLLRSAAPDYHDGEE